MTEAKPKKRRWKECMSRKRDPDRSYAKSRINIGKAYQRWREFRELNGFNSDAQVALFLLDRKEPVSEIISEMSHQPVAMLPTGASRSAPSQRGPAFLGAVACNSDLASLFECPVCVNFMQPPIVQCQNGHLVCSSCRPRLTCCPICRGPLGSIRNLAMENVARLVFPTCKYAPMGCEVRLPHASMAKHEEHCEYGPRSCYCPCAGSFCMWRGSLSAIVPHLLHQHTSIATLQGEDNTFTAKGINLPGAANWVMMQSCFGFHFMLILEKQNCKGKLKFFAIMLLMGTRKQAERFTYRLELKGHRRRLTWEAAPRSVQQGVASAIANAECLALDMSVAQLFAENGNLGINVTISMQGEETF